MYLLLIHIIPLGDMGLTDETLINQEYVHMIPIFLKTGLPAR